jgi:uncharacterized protein YecT (DUF1311 family)
MRNFFGWLVIFGCCLLGGCSHSQSPDILAQVSGVWTEGTPNSMVYLNLAGHQKTFAMAAMPGIIYPADVTAIDLQNRIVTVNVSFPGKGGETYVVRPYVFRQVPAGQEGQFRLVMTAPTGRQAMLSFVRQLSKAEHSAQPTEFASAAGNTELEPAVPAPGPTAAGAPPAAGQHAIAPTQPATRPAPAPAAPPTVTPPPAPAAPPAAKLAQAPVAPPVATPAPKPAKPPAAKPPVAKPAPKPAKPTPAPPPAAKPAPKPAPPPAAKPAPKPVRPRAAKPAPKPARPPAAKPAQKPARPPATGPSTCREGTPAARHGCAARAFHTVDRALNKRYREVMAGLPASRRAALARQEIQWIRLKRRQCEAQARRTPGGDLLRRTAQLQCWTALTQKRLAKLEHDY